MTEAAIDRVLTAAPPTFTEEEAAALARELFGVEGVAASVASERDQTFLIDGDRPAVLKISNAAEDPARLDMEALAAQRVAQVDPGCRSRCRGWSRARPTPDDPARTAPRQRRAERRTACGCTTGCPVGRECAGASLSDEAVRDWGTMAARVGRALRGFWHPSATRVMLWDVQHALRLRPMLGAVRDPDAAGARRTRHSTDTSGSSRPIWPSLRAQVIHTDLCASNVLVDDGGRGDRDHRLRRRQLVGARGRSGRRCSRPIVEGREGDDVLPGGAPRSSTATRRSRRSSPRSARSWVSCLRRGCAPPSSCPRRAPRSTTDPEHASAQRPRAWRDRSAAAGVGRLGRGRRGSSAGGSRAGAGSGSGAWRSGAAGASARR